MDDRFDALRTGLARVVEGIHRVAPGARVLLVDYLSILPPHSASASRPLPAEVADWGRRTADRLSRELEAVAAANPSTRLFVAAGAASRDHHAWSTEPFTRRFHLSLRGGAPYHPNAVDMTAVAQLVDEHLDSL